MAGLGAFRIPQRVRDRWSGRVMTVGNGSCLPDGRQTPCLGPETGFPIAEPGMTLSGGLLGIPVRPRTSHQKVPLDPMTTRPEPDDRACCSANTTSALELTSAVEFPPLPPGAAKEGTSTPGNTQQFTLWEKRTRDRLQALTGITAGLPW